MRNLMSTGDNAMDTAVLRRRFMEVRAYTEHLSAALTAEDQCIQSMPDASPAKWHRAHTTWFFETFVLLPHAAGYELHDRRFQVLFNSYYVGVGARHPRPARGLLTRPGAEEVGAYRRAVDGALLAALDELPAEALGLLELGLHHEQQHQELLLTDILHAFAQNPLAPACLPRWREPTSASGPTGFVACAGGITRVGARGGSFAFDNEMPVHRVLLAPYRLASRLVRNAEFQAFVEDGGYETPTLWMSDGWDKVQAETWTAPLYWRREAPGAPVMQFTPAGLQPLDPDAPVRHVSWYEADAYARWAGARLPTEAELEHGANSALAGLEELTGHVWQWTQSAYSPYPGFRAALGAVGEYNGKFMINQMVLRGGSAATPPGHTRPTYRNFFAPEKRWQFTGLRLARDD
jgi:ergothioneine biosynthesis protein EgtB